MRSARDCWGHGLGERKSREPQQLDCVARTMHVHQCAGFLKEKMSSMIMSSVITSEAPRVSNLYRFRDTITQLLKFKQVTWPWTHPFRNYCITHTLVLSMVNLRTKFEELHPFQRCDGAQKFKTGSHDHDHAHVGEVCHPKADTWYGLPVYDI